MCPPNVKLWASGANPGSPTVFMSVRLMLWSMTTGWSAGTIREMWLWNRLRREVSLQQPEKCGSRGAWDRGRNADRGLSMGRPALYVLRHYFLVACTSVGFCTETASHENGFWTHSKLRVTTLLDTLGASSLCVCVCVCVCMCVYVCAKLHISNEKDSVFMGACMPLG